MNDTKFCTNCGCQIALDVEKCPQCGADLKPTERTTKYCQHCGQLIDKECVVCPHCGKQVADLKTAAPQAAPQPTIVVNNTNTAVGSGRGKEINKWIAALLCFFLGGIGAHKFYEGKIGMGILYIFTLGLVGIGVLVDFIVILTKPNPYYV